jgi:peroxiredoxin
MQRYLPEIQAAGGALVAISGEPADRSAEVKTADSLTFPVLSDTGLISTRKFGLVYELPKVINDAVIEIGFDMAKYYNAPKAELPISATYVVGKDGIVRYAYLEVDYKKRAEPSDVIAALKKLKM